jgi:hypothetical protein
VEFLERWKKDACSDKEERDDVEFWEQQKKEYFKINPTHALAIAEMKANEEADQTVEL